MDQDQLRALIEGGENWAWAETRTIGLVKMGKNTE
jgi:hypothetical protein